VRATEPLELVVESLCYLTATRPGILYGVGLVSTQSLLHKFIFELQRIFRYIKGIIDYGMFCTSGDDPSLVGYTESDCADDVDDRSTLNNVFFLGNTAFT